MRRSSRPKIFLTLLMLGSPALASAQNPNDRPQTVEESDLTQDRVRDLLTCRARVASKELVRRGEKAFPDYEAILADKDATAAEVVAIFGLVSVVKADRSRFVKYAVCGLRGHDAEARGRARFKGVPDKGMIDTWNSEDSRVREAALGLLGAIGSEKEAAEVFKLVVHRDQSVRDAAEEATAAIGGPAQLANLDLLLEAKPNAANVERLERRRKCRDLLKRRLDALEKAKKRDKAEPSPEPSR